LKVLLSWMQQFAPIEGESDALAATLTDLGLVVESVATVGAQWDGIVVAKVLDLRPHPEADRIQLVDVDTGGVASPAGEALQICCGAFNMAVGDLVPLATLGTVMPGGLEIARRKLRGEWSNGMICSGAELELDDDTDGIKVLDSSYRVGQALVEAMGVESDVLFDIDVEGNRPDALSVAGVARDLAARLGVPFAFPPSSFVETESATASQSSIDIQDKALCARFGLRVLENVTVGTSPGWMAARLQAAGMRPINSIVDISNYVMLELGAPNHTYDLDLVPNGHLRVRMGRVDETLTTLDSQERQITEADGLICNENDEPIGLAGVMGGLSTEITEGTTRVLLEAAVWDRMTIAKTSRRLNLRSEASTRFERGADPLGIERALDRFAELAVELCGATVNQGALVVEGGYAPTPAVLVRPAKVNHLLNTELSTGEIASLLRPIGFESQAEGDNLLVAVPSWRPDSSIEEDIVEEVGRHHGYDKSGRRVPTPAQNGELTPNQLGRRRIRRALMGVGFSEAMPMPFLAPDDLVRAGLADDGITLDNPLVAEESVLRTSLLPGLLKAVAYNQSHRNPAVQLFELGRVYLANPDADAALPIEPEWVAAIMAGHDAGHATQMLHQLAQLLRLNGLTIKNAERPGLHPSRSAEVIFRGRTLGEVGEVDPRVLEAFDIAGRVGWLQLDVAPINSALANNAKYRPVSLYPSSDIDLAFIVADDVAVPSVITTLEKTGGTLLQSVRFLNAFRSDQVGEGVRSLAFGLRFQATDRTLTDGEVAELRQKLIDAVVAKNGATFRQ
jgi:phenylalanyl-tRNA synthetase beta chain